MSFHPLYREIMVRRQPKVEITYASVELVSPNDSLVIKQVVTEDGAHFLIEHYMDEGLQEVHQVATLEAAYARAHEVYKEDWTLNQSVKRGLFPKAA